MASHSSKGNVLFIILIAVGLFAALAYTVSNSFRGGTDTISKEQARVAAGTIIRAMNDAKQGMDFLYTQRACSIYTSQSSNISLYNPANPIFLPEAVRGYECFVYHSTGAGVAFPQYLAQYQIADMPQANMFTAQLLPMQLQTYDAIQKGISSADKLPITIALIGIADPYCIAFNHAFKISINDDIPPNNNDARFAGKQGGCFRYGSDTLNFAYMIYQDMDF